MISSTTTFDWSQPQMNGTTANLTRPMPSFHIKTAGVDGSATAADQQAAAAAAPLKCPRCDSSNTKFCYYNNYSLSQPRHFCKACKRYWTRGGTLRNVPVGGGCRKTKQRVRQPNIKLPTGHRSSISHDNGPDQTARNQGHMEAEPNLGLSNMLYVKNMEIFNRYGASRVTDPDVGDRVNSSSAYNQIHNLGLGLSPGDYIMNQSNTSTYISSYSTLFGSNLSSPGGISSVLGSGREYGKLVHEPSSFLSALPLEDMQIGGNDQGLGRRMKGEELGQMNKFNQMGSLSSSPSDPSLHNWNEGPSNTWPDVPNIGSSVMSLL